jgi:hypothetical protein
VNANILEVFPMPSSQIALIILAAVLAVIVVTLMVKAVVWLGRDARQRGFERVWLLQLLAVIEFPWPWLMYYLTVRKLDQRRSESDGSSAAQAGGS